MGEQRGSLRAGSDHDSVLLASCEDSVRELRRDETAPEHLPKESYLPFNNISTSNQMLEGYIGRIIYWYVTSKITWTVVGTSLHQQWQ